MKELTIKVPEEYRDEFLKNCEDLVRQYLMFK